MTRLVSLLLAALLAAPDASAASLVLKTTPVSPVPALRFAPLVDVGSHLTSSLLTTEAVGLQPSLLLTPQLVPSVLVPAVVPTAVLQPTVLQTVQVGVEALQAARNPGETGKTLDSMFIGDSFSAPADFGSAVTPEYTPSLLSPSSLPSAASDEEILSDLKQNKPSALVFDYDNTLVDRGPDGLSGAPSEALIAAVVKVLRAGVPVALATSRYFDAQPEGASFAMTVFEPFISKIPAELRSGLSFSGGVGGELVSFDENGEPQRLLNGIWTETEAQVLRESAAQASQELGSDIALNVVIGPGQFMAKLPKGDTRAAAVAAALTASLASSGMNVQVLHNREFIYFSKFSKAEGVRQLFANWRSRGVAVTEESLLLVGDEFRLPHGGDSAMATAFPKARAITVGDSEAGSLPSSVKRLGRRGGAGSLAILQAVGDGLMPRAQKASVSETAARKATLGAFIGAAAVVALVGLFHVPAAAAMGGSVLLTIIGLPQIWRNFKQGASATKDLASASYFIWLGAACLLTVTSLLRGANGWWIASNLAGVLEAFIVIGQLAAHRGQKTLALKALALPAAAAALMLLPVAAPALASVVFAAAMGLLLMLNIPQIVGNFKLYEKEGRIPQGASPLYPALVAGGSLLHLMAALALGDAFWAANAVSAILSVAVVLGQIYMPKTVNALLRPVSRLYAYLRRGATKSTK